MPAGRRPFDAANEEALVIKFGPIETNAVHVCVDMQRMFMEQTDWRLPWMERVLPQVRVLVAARPEATAFTRFVPPARPDRASGSWRRYYERWPRMTLDELGELVGIVPALAGFAPPAIVIDKNVYSPWLGSSLPRHLEDRHCPCVIVSGGETDVCVLATIMGAVDRGLRVVVARDALCSSADETHDHLLALYDERFGEQVETASVEEILDMWPSS